MENLISCVICELAYKETDLELLDLVLKLLMGESGE